MRSMRWWALALAGLLGSWPVAGCLGQMPAAAPAAAGGVEALVESLVNQLQNSDESIRLMSAKALGKLGPKAAAATAALARAAMSDPDEDVRRVAAKSLEIIRGPTAPSYASPPQSSISPPAQGVQPSPAATTVAAPGWREFTSAEGAFSVLLPGRPAEQQQRFNSASGEIKVMLYMLDAPQQVAYVVSYIDYPPAEVVAGQETKLLDDTRQSTLARIKGTVVSDNKILYEGRLPGRHLVMAIPEQQTRWQYRIYLLGRRVYQLVVSRPMAAANDDEDRKFLDSFRLSVPAAATRSPAQPPTATVREPAAPEKGSPAAAAPPDVHRRLAGQWVSHYTGADGAPVVEWTIFRSDGEFHSLVRTEAGQVVKSIAGRYTIDNAKVIVTVNGESITLLPVWINDNRLAFNFGAGLFTYDRVAEGAGPAAEPTPQPHAGPGAAAQPGHVLPPGFASRLVKGGSGQVVVGQTPPVRSAARLLTASLSALSGYFDQRPVLCENAAIVDRDDRSAQAVFTARLGGQPVLGIALCVAGPQEGYLAAVFDRADQPLRPALGALVQAALEATPRAVVWQEVPMPDGRGSVKLPKDWKILSSAQGTLVAMSAAEGSDLGMAVELGQAFPVQTPEGFAKVTLPAGPNGPMDRRNYPVALQGDPAQAMESLLNGFFSSYSEMKGGPPLRFGRLIVAESVPPAISNAQSAYLYFQSERGKPPAAQARQSLALITTAPLSQDTWMFYYSMVSAPAETFFRDLPILEEIWRSWRAADWVHAGRITAALDSQKAAGGIWRAYYESQQQLGPRTLDAWSEWTGQVHASIQPQTGEIQDLRLAWVDDLLGRLSQREGADRYRKLTPGELKY